MVKAKYKVGHIPIPDQTEAVGKSILDAAYGVHTALGPGLSEQVYEACLAFEIREKGLTVETQVLLPVVSDGVRIETGLRNVLHLQNGFKRLVL